MTGTTLNGISQAPWFVPTAEACGIFDRRLQTLTDMVDGSDLRLVGKSALLNVIVRLQSIKNGQARLVESHTCELLFAYELEMDPLVTAYACQPPCRRIQNVTKGGKLHITRAHLDFLVFYPDRIDLVECKKPGWLERKGASKGWTNSEGKWEHQSYRRFAEDLGLTFRLWTPPFPAGTFQQNLEICYSALMDRGIRVPPCIADAVFDALRTQYCSLATLLRNVAGLTPRHVLSLLAEARIFGSLASASLNDSENFYLGLDQEIMRTRDEIALRDQFLSYEDERPGSALSRSSITARGKACQRLDTLEAIDRGERKSTRNSKKLTAARDRAIALGRSPMEALLPAYHLSGNRGDRLDSAVREELNATIKDSWLSGDLVRQADLYQELKDRCLRKGLTVPGKKTLWSALQRIPKERIALVTGGKRAFHAVRPSSDPLHRSRPPLGVGQVVHVDSTDVDLRHEPDLVALIPEGKAKLYYAVDGHSGCAMARALIFGPARTDGLALLHRDYVRRHGREPCMYHFDRGPENKSHWVNHVCDGHTHIRWSPAGGSQFNSQVEQCLKQINHYVAHQLIGNTLPDRAGRSVDGKFKSRKNAKTSFSDLSRMIDEYLFGDYQATPGQDGFTPVERRDEGIGRWGFLGTPRQVDEDFLFETSVPIKLGKRVVPNKGVRTESGFYVSEELTTLTSRGRKVDEARADAEDPSFIYVRVGRAVVKAFLSDIQMYAVMSPQERLFELLSAPLIRSAKRVTAEEIALDRHRRTRAQNAKTNARWNRKDATDRPGAATSAGKGKVPVCDWEGIAAYEAHDEDY